MEDDKSIACETNYMSAEVIVRLCMEFVVWDKKGEK